MKKDMLSKHVGIELGKSKPIQLDLVSRKIKANMGLLPRSGKMYKGCGGSLDNLLLLDNLVGPFQPW